MANTTIDKLPKHYRRHLELPPNSETKRILVFKEKHGTLYLDASTVNKTLQAYLYIVLSMYGENGNLGNIRNYVSDTPKKPSYSEDDIKTLPKELQKKARQELDKYTCDRINHEQETAQAEMVEKIIKDNDAVLAFLYAHEQWGQERELRFEYVHNPELMLEDV